MNRAIANSGTDILLGMRRIERRLPLHVVLTG